jgi:hypothetical protein
VYPDQYMGITLESNIWVRPNDFLLERWLAKPNDELEAHQGDAYCPFEIRPRS